MCMKNKTGWHESDWGHCFRLGGQRWHLSPDCRGDIWAQTQTLRSTPPSEGPGKNVVNRGNSMWEEHGMGKLPNSSKSQYSHLKNGNNSAHLSLLLGGLCEDWVSQRKWGVWPAVSDGFFVCVCTLTHCISQGSTRETTSRRCVCVCLCVCVHTLEHKLKLQSTRGISSSGKLQFCS